MKYLIRIDDSQRNLMVLALNMLQPDSEAGREARDALIEMLEGAVPSTTSMPDIENNFTE